MLSNQDHEILPPIGSSTGSLASLAGSLPSLDAAASPPLAEQERPLLRSSAATTAAATPAGETLPLLPSKEKDASVASGTINLANTILGAGMLALPYGFAQLGYVLGCMLLLLFGAMSFFSLSLLARLAEWINNLEYTITGDRKSLASSSYGACARRLYPWATEVLDIAVTLKLIGVMVSYLIIVSDIAADVFVYLAPMSSELLHPPQFWLVVIVSCLTPLCFFQRLDSQRFASSIALTSVIGIVVMILTFPMWGHPEHVSGIVPFRISTRIFNVLPLFIFAFCCHQNMFSVANEYSPERRTRKSNLTIILSAASSYPVYLSVAIAGYLTIGPDVNSNVLNSYPDSIVLTIAKLSLLVLIAFAFPIQFHPARLHLDHLLFSKKSPSWHPFARHISLTIFLLLLTFSISYFVRNLSLVLGLVGSTGSTLMVYVLPGIFYFKAFAHRTFKEDKKRIASVFLVVLGCLIIVFSTSIQIITAISGK
jgi:amino acid permease